MHSSSAPLGRHILSGTVGIFLAEALFPLTGFVTAIFLTRRLGSEGYGLFTLVATLVAWVEGSLTALFARVTLKLVAEAEDWQPVGAAIVRWHLAVGVGAALLLWALAPPIAALSDEPALASYLRVFALDIPLYCLAHAHRDILVGVGRFHQRALVRAGRWIARLLFIVVLVELGFSVHGAIVGSIGASLVEFGIGRLYIRPALLRGPSFPLRRLWIDTGPLLLSALSLALYSKLDLFALKMLGGTTEQAGLYGAAQNLTVVPGIFALSFSPLLLSTLSRVLRTEERHYAQGIGRDAMRLVVVLLPFAGMTAGAAPEIVSAIFGPTFLPAAPLLAVLMFGALALVMISVTTAILTAAGKPGWTFAITGPMVPLAVIGHLLLVPQLGAIGAALVTALFAGLGALAAMAAVYYLWQVFPPLGTVGRSVMVCGAALGLAAFWSAPGALLLVKLPVIAVFIGLAFLVLGEFSAREIALARSIVDWRATPENAPEQAS